MNCQCGLDILVREALVSARCQLESQVVTREIVEVVEGVLGQL